jgi:hypothetical protein
MNTEMDPSSENENGNCSGGIVNVQFVDTRQRVEAGMYCRRRLQVLALPVRPIP